MKYLYILVFLFLLALFVIFKEVSVLQYFSVVVQETTDPQDLIIVSKNESSRNYTSSADSRTPEPEVTQYTTSSAATPSISFHESDFCSDREYEPISEIPQYWINRCPEKPAVTAHQLGRLGNQMWEYASAWTVAKTLDREPFTPTCIIRALEKVFENLTAIPPLKYIEHCPIKFDHMHNMELVEQAKGNVALQWYAQIPQYLVPQLKEVLQLFQFHDHLTEKSQNILRTASKGVSDFVYVSVHVRRTDYTNHLKGIYNLTMVNGDFFLRQMNYFRNKYYRVIFVIVSDDPDWCDHELSANDTVVARGNSPEQDLSLLASCNHSIMDYGTFGMWGAMMAGGETLLYKLPSGLEVDLVKLMPKWNLVT